MVSGTLPKKLLLVRELPAWLHERGVSNQDGRPLSLSSVYAYLRKHKIPVSRLGRMRVDEAEMERALRGDVVSEPDVPVRQTRRKTQARQDRERQEQDRRNKRARERLGFKT